MKTREEAFKLLKENIKNENLIKHCLAVEAAMKHYADIFGENKEKWGIAGLLHDIDYEAYPKIEEHGLRGAEMLEKEGFESDIAYAVKAHNRHHNITLQSMLDKTLLAVDELTGLIVAAALVRPSKSVKDVKVKSIKKRMKEKAFARNVNRAEIIEGAEAIGTSLDEHIENVLNAMKSISDDLGL